MSTCPSGVSFLNPPLFFPILHINNAAHIAFNLLNFPSRLNSVFYWNLQERFYFYTTYPIQIMKYQKTQIGWFMIILFLFFIAHLTYVYLQQSGNNPLPFGAYIVLFIAFIGILLCFYKLQVKIDDLGIQVIFGIGLIHIRIKPEKVYHVRVVNTPWYYGLGIRFTSKGMLYNIQGSSAVEINYLDGKNKTVLIGSNDSHALKNFIIEKYHVESEDPT